MTTKNTFDALNTALQDIYNILRNVEEELFDLRDEYDIILEQNDDLSSELSRMQAEAAGMCDDDTATSLN